VGSHLPVWSVTAPEVAGPSNSLETAILCHAARRFGDGQDPLHGRGDVLTIPAARSHGCLDWNMAVQTKFLRLGSAVALGDLINCWRACWLGGWDKGRVFFVVIVCQLRRTP
jgi:hypothetical protein